MNWREVIGNGQERSLLDAVVGIMLDGDGEHLDLASEGPGGIDPGKFKQAVYDKLIEDWEEGFLIEAHFTLDDFATLSSRLARLTSDQWLDMLADMGFFS